MNNRQIVAGLIRRAPGLFVLDLVLSALFGSSFSLLGIFLRRYFNIITGKHHLEIVVWELVAIMAASVAARTAVMFGKNINGLAMRTYFATLIRHNLLDQVLTRPGARSTRGSAGEAMTVFRDDVDQINGIFGTIGLLALQVSFSLWAIFLMLHINWRVTLIVFVPLIAVVLAVRCASGHLERYRQATYRATSRVTEAIAEMFRSAQALQLASAEGRMTSHFETLNANRREASLKELMYNSALGAVMSNMTALGTVAIFIGAAPAIREGRFTVGDFSLFNYFLGYVTITVGTLGGSLAQLRQLGVSRQRMNDLVHGIRTGDPSAIREVHADELVTRPAAIHLWGRVPARNAIPASFTDPLETLYVQGLSYTHPGSANGIHAIDLTIRRGEIVVVTGQVGSGKTTLVRCLLGLVSADRGRICWNGSELAEPGKFLIPPRCAYTAQSPQIFDMTLRENILLGLPQELRLDGAVHAAVLEDDVKDMADGLDTFVGPNGARLSGGQKQRAAIARMFARDAELYVIDDMSSALDRLTGLELWHRLFERDCVTCLIVSHSRQVLERADRIIVMKEGRIDASGSLSDLLENSEEMCRLWYDELHSNVRASDVSVAEIA